MLCLMHMKKRKYIMLGGIVVGLACLLMLPTVASLLIVSFTSQSPFGDWSQPWQDACEESSLVMVDSFYHDRTLNNSIAEQAILNVLKMKEKYYGASLDENAEQIADMVNKFFSWEARVVENPTLDQMKKELDEKRPIILPTDGKQLKNPNFLNGGPDYHVIVLSGYNEKKKVFVSQDPGTKKGHNYEYSYETIMSAMHDFLPNNQTKNAKKLAVFTNKDFFDSGKTDGDGDDLLKKDELIHGTNLFSPDTDNDSYLDGEEVLHGYSPLTNESKIGAGELIRSEDNNRVYLIEDGDVRHVVSPEALAKNNWSWSQVKNVSTKFFSKFGFGREIK